MHQPGKTVLPQTNLVERICRSILFARLAKLRDGMVTLLEGQRRHTFGDTAADLRANVRVHDARFYRRFVTGGGLGVTESLLDGDWSCDDLTALIRIFIRNLKIADRFDLGLGRLQNTAARCRHWWRKNTRQGAVRNIRRHYDLGNDFYRLFLDETMNYSCGVFEHSAATMHDASLAKMRRVCRKLDLKPTDHLLEVGSGWGGLAIYAAQNYGCRVTTTTISREQHDLARRRVREAGLGDRVQVLLRDYRDLSGRYDKLVSIEMIEAVGHQYFDTFFRKCSELLKPAGQMLLQSIVIKDQRYQEHLRRVDFIREYIFPGGCLPSVAALLQSSADSTDLRLLQCEDLAPHYVKTLRCWREEFTERLDDVRRQNYSESFIRMWNYYLCYCEAAFAERQVNVVQLLLAKPKCRFDPVKLSAAPEIHAAESARPVRQHESRQRRETLV